MAALLPASVQPLAGSRSDWAGGRAAGAADAQDLVRCRRVPPSPGGTGAGRGGRAKAGRCALPRTKKAPFVRQTRPSRPVADKRRRPPALGETGMGETPGWAESPATMVVAWSTWPPQGLGVPWARDPSSSTQTVRIWPQPTPPLCNSPGSPWLAAEPCPAATIPPPAAGDEGRAPLPPLLAAEPGGKGRVRSEGCRGDNTEHRAAATASRCRCLPRAEGDRGPLKPQLRSPPGLHTSQPCPGTHHPAGAHTASPPPPRTPPAPVPPSSTAHRPQNISQHPVARSSQVHGAVAPWGAGQVGPLGGHPISGFRARVGMGGGGEGLRKVHVSQGQPAHSSHALRKPQPLHAASPGTARHGPRGAGGGRGAMG